MANGKRWTSDDKKEIVKMLKNGLSYDEIASQMKRTTVAVRHMAYKQGMQNQRPPLWTQDDWTNFANWYSEGYAVESIAKALGRTSAAIMNQTRFLDKSIKIARRIAGVKKEQVPHGTTNVIDDSKPSLNLPATILQWAKDAKAKIVISFD